MGRPTEAKLRLEPGRVSVKVEDAEGLLSDIDIDIGEDKTEVTVGRVRLRVDELSWFIEVDGKPRAAGRVDQIELDIQ